MIVVVGSLNLDLVVRVDRLPDAGETLLALGYAEHAGGKGANQAVAAARAGGRVAMVGRVGRDEAGRRLRDGLAAEGIDVSEVREAEAPTGRALIEVDRAGRNRIVVVGGANLAWGPDELPSDLLRRADVVLLQREVPASVVAEAVRRSGPQARVVLNLAPAGEVADEVLRRVDVLVVNESEAAWLTGSTVEEVAADPFAAARTAVRRGPHDVVVTLGAAGALSAGASGETRAAGHAVAAVDTTGAGDAFVGALAARLHEGGALADALAFGCASGAEAVLREGAQPSLPARTAILERIEGA